jgi:NAD(P)-dependent dehydrogenase (short-subunit alcohol dehydrogenase family)
MRPARRSLRSCALSARKPSLSTPTFARRAAFASIYVGAKHAVEGITKSVALEVAKSGVRVNAVAPGPTDTGMLTRFTGTAENKPALATQVPLGRLGLSDEVADGIVFIASNEAKFITGHVLNVDGGHSAN